MNNACVLDIKWVIRLYVSNIYLDKKDDEFNIEKHNKLFCGHNAINLKGAY